MSKRIYNKADMKDRALAIQALQQAGMAFEESGGVIYIQSGPMANSRIELATGEVVGDSDFGHTSESLGVLRLHYAEAKVRQDYAKTGTAIDSREVTSEGDIVLMWHMG